MEIHTCFNCRHIEVVLLKRIKWFDLLNAENISLHTALISASKQIHNLMTKIANLQSITINDQSEIFKLYMQVETHKYENKINEEASDEKLLSLMDYQKRINDEQIDLLICEKDISLKQFDKQATKLNDHIKVLLEELDLCRKELFKRNNENLNDRKLFHETIDNIKQENQKYFIEIRKENMSKAYEKIKTKTENMLKKQTEQLEQRDELIKLLKEQQEVMKIQIETLLSDNETITNKFNNKIIKLKEHLKRSREKYLILEKRRRLDMEGYQSDVKLLKKEFENLKISDKIKVVEMKEKIANLEEKIVKI